MTTKKHSNERNTTMEEADALVQEMEQDWGYSFTYVDMNRFLVVRNENDKLVYPLSLEDGTYNPNAIRILYDMQKEKREHGIS